MILRFLLTAAAMCSSFGSPEDAVPEAMDPRIHYNTVEFICSEGYYAQEHEVHSEDGYIMRIYRIPNRSKHPRIPSKRSHYQRVHDGYHPDFGNCFRDGRRQVASGPPVLLAHGVLASSDGWLLQGANSDLAYLLVERGYDVWFSNIRGNFYSRRHKTLRPSQQEFWDFSFHENGLYDMPKTIDYILSVTNYTKLTYVGHSMGTTMFFVMASSMPEYNEKVQLFVGMAPVSQIRRQSYIPSRRVVVLAVMDLMKACDRIGLYEFLPRTNLLNLFFKTLCAPGSLLQNLCYDSILAIFGYPSKLYLRKLFPTFLSHCTNGVSVKTFLHYNQHLDAPAFQCYDYGPKENVERYGQEKPPKYDLRKVTTPTVLFYSKGDFVSDAKDVAHMMSLLPNVVEAHDLLYFNHIDFIWAYNARKLMYNRIVGTIDKYSNRSK